MKHVNSLLAIIALLVTFSVSAQETTFSDPIDSLGKEVSKVKEDVSFLKRLKVNGWVQAQYQHSDTLGAATVAGGNFASMSDNRMILRRGRIKFTYEHSWAQYVLQIDVIDPTLTAPLNSATPSATSTIPFAVNVRDFFVKINAPFFKPLTFTGGMQNRPFGFEIGQSSQFRETPERSRFTQMLFPNERDMGAMITLQAPNSSPLHIFKINAGMFNGSGIAREFDAKKDFIGQIMMNRSTKNERIQYGIGVSYYYGGTVQTDSTVYSTVTNGVFVKNYNASNIGSYAKREYMGVDAQVSIDTKLGMTTLRGEYVQGTQPGLNASNRSFEIAPVGAMYVRNFNAAYFYFIHKIAKLPIQLVYKYDFFDPNTSVSGAQITKAGNFGVGDIKYTTQGFGINYLASANVKFMFYYDMITNETTGWNDGKTNGVNYMYDKRDNLFTARVQYRF